MDITQQVNSELYKLWDMEYTEASLRKAREVLKLAETTGDLSLIFKAQKEVMNHATFTGKVEELLNAFTWCRAMVDKHPQKFRSFNITWEYKWVITNVFDFPQISFEQVEEMIDDLKKRTSSTEQSLSISTLRMFINRVCNQTDKLQEAYKNFKKADRDSNSNCSACVLDAEVDALIDLQRYEEAREKVKPLFEGKLKCASVPKATYGDTLVAYQDFDENLAWQHHLKGYRLVKQKSLGFIINHLEFLVVSEKLKRFTDIFQQQISKYKKATPLDRVDFSLVCTAFFNKLLKSGKTEISLKIPAEYKSHLLQNGKYSVDKLKHLFEKDCRKLAEAFDGRNGNSWYTEELAKALN